MTVFNPHALKRMVEKGTFRTVPVKELVNTDFDEAFYFRYPSNNIINQDNNDGDFIEIWDYKADGSWIATERGDLTVSPDTVVYVR